MFALYFEFLFFYILEKRLVWSLSLNLYVIAKCFFFFCRNNHFIFLFTQTETKEKKNKRKQFREAFLFFVPCIIHNVYTWQYSINACYVTKQFRAFSGFVLFFYVVLIRFYFHLLYIRRPHNWVLNHSCRLPYGFYFYWYAHCATVVRIIEYDEHDWKTKYEFRWLHDKSNRKLCEIAWSCQQQYSFP